jgi:HD superfamily phosphodiesterase
MNGIISKTRRFIKKYMEKLDDISHDYAHINYVIRFSLKIAKREGITDKKELFYIKMGALLHDYEDSKYSDKCQAEMINEYLKKHKELTSYDRLEIVKIASNISLSKESNEDNEDNENNDRTEIKMDIVKDADRINSLGSVGIMRYISYNINNNEKPSFDEIISNMKKRTDKIKKLLKTKSGKKMAKKHLKLIDTFISNYEYFGKKRRR